MGKIIDERLREECETHRGVIFVWKSEIKIYKGSARKSRVDGGIIV